MGVVAPELELGMIHFVNVQPRRYQTKSDMSHLV
jgi:hypothetical protein